MPKKKKRKKLSHGLGSITELSKNRINRFWARKEAISLPDGKLYRESVGLFPTYEDAYKALIEPNLNDKDKTTIIELYNFWRESPAFEKLERPTQDRYDKDIRRFEPLIYKPISQVTYDNLQKKLNKIQANGYTRGKDPTKRPFSKDKLQKIIQAINIAYIEAIKRNIIENNLTDLLDYYGTSKKKTFDIFNKKEINFMFDNIQNIPEIKFILLNIYTGLRPIEMVSLKKEHIDLTNKTIHGMGKKTEAGKNKTIIILPDIEEILINLYNSTDEYILGRKMSQDYYRKHIFYKVLDKLNIRNNRTPYTCRDTFAALMNHFNVDKQTIKNMMGHTSFSTTSDNYIPFDLDKNTVEMSKIKIREK